MTKQLKKILLLILFGILIFSFINCEYDDSAPKKESAIESQRKFNVKKIRYDELIKNKKLANQLNKLSTDKSVRKDINGKVIYSQEQNFYIDTNFATYIENENGGHSYTFLINRDSTNVKLENLVLTSTDSVYYKMYIAQYNITDDELMQLKNGETLDLSNKTILLPINDTELFNNIFSKVLVINSGSGGCVIGVTSIAGSTCSGSQHHSYGEPCEIGDATPNMLIYTWGECMEEGGGGGGSSDGNDGIITFGGGGSGSGGTGGSDDDNIDTSPIFEDNEEEIDCNTTAKKLGLLFPNAPLENREKLAEYINDHATKFGIDTKEKLCHFLAQTGAETGGFTTLSVTENMNYTTPSRLIIVYPSKFSFTDPNKENPNNYINNPQGLANFVYCCMYGNGDTSSGDGWYYRGGGIMQLTWKSNYLGYQNFLNSIGLGWSYSQPDNVRNDYRHSIISGMWYFKNRVLDKMTISPSTSVDKVTKKVNPGADKEMKQERTNIFNQAMQIINCL